MTKKKLVKTEVETFDYYQNSQTETKQAVCGIKNYEADISLLEDQIQRTAEVIKFLEKRSDLK